MKDEWGFQGEDTGVHQGVPGPQQDKFITQFTWAHQRLERSSGLVGLFGNSGFI